MLVRKICSNFPKILRHVKEIVDLTDDSSDFSQGSADSNYSQPSSDLSLDEEKESLRREKERQALNQLEKARVSHWSFTAFQFAPLSQPPVAILFFFFSRVLDHLSILWASHYRRNIFSACYKHHEFVWDATQPNASAISRCEGVRERNGRDANRNTSRNFLSRS